MRLLADVRTRLLRILERIGLRRILLGFDEHPAFIVALHHDVEDRAEVDVAIARDREHAGADTIEEAHVLCLDLVAHLHADVLQMDMADAREILLEDCNWIFARADEMARVKEKGDILGVRLLHEAVDLGRRLDAYVIVRP